MFLTQYRLALSPCLPNFKWLATYICISHFPQLAYVHLYLIFPSARICARPFTSSETPQDFHIYLTSQHLSEFHTFSRLALCSGLPEDSNSHSSQVSQWNGGTYQTFVFHYDTFSQVIWVFLPFLGSNIFRPSSGIWTRMPHESPRPVCDSHMGLVFQIHWARTLLLSPKCKWARNSAQVSDSQAIQVFQSAHGSQISPDSHA